MTSKKFRSLFPLVVILISYLLLTFSNTSSNLSNSFEENSSTPVTDVRVSPARNSLVSISPSVSENVISSNVLSHNEELYRVVKVVDGDTFDVDINGKTERLRMIGIDTPETVDPRKSVQCFGKEASNKAKDLLINNSVYLESDPTQGDRDKYGRLLRYAFLPDRTNFGLFMISEGYAHEYTYRYPYKYQFDFKQAEINARENNKGLWSSSTCSGNK